MSGRDHQLQLDGSNDQTEYDVLAPPSSAFDSLNTAVLASFSPLGEYHVFDNAVPESLPTTLSTMVFGSMMVSSFAMATIAWQRSSS